MNGRWIVVASWVSVGAFVVPATLEAVGIDAMRGATVAICLGLFLVSLPVWAYAFWVAVVRSARGEDVTVGRLFGLMGSAPKDVRRHLLGALAASIVFACALMFVDPYVVLVPMLQLGLVGMWAARYGAFPPRPVPRPRQAGVRKPREQGERR